MSFRLEMDLTHFDLDALKSYRYKEIDNRTGEIVDTGFDYSAKKFSLSKNAQINISGLHQSKDDPALTYPIVYNTVDDSESYDVTDSADLHAMYLTALATKKGLIDSGTTLKELVRVAIDIPAVNAIIDNR